MKTIVHFVRHGEAHNPDNVLYGRLPGFNLSELGRRQALVVAETLADHDIAFVMSSPLERARQTAAPIASAHRLDVDVDERLIESANAFEGVRTSPFSRVLRQYKHWPKLRNPRLPSWGEPYTEIADRMLDALHQAHALASGREAVCVSHQTPIWVLRRFLEAKPLWHDPRRRQCEVASITSFVFSADVLVDVVYSDPASSLTRASRAKATGVKVTG